MAEHRQTWEQVMQVQELQTEAVSSVELARQAQQARVTKLAPPPVLARATDRDDEDAELAQLPPAPEPERDDSPESSPTVSPCPPLVIATTDSFVGSSGFTTVAAPVHITPRNTRISTVVNAPPGAGPLAPPSPEWANPVIEEVPPLQLPVERDTVSVPGFAELVNNSELVEDAAALFIMDSSPFAGAVRRPG